jgi:hypothetical protein
MAGGERIMKYRLIALLSVLSVLPWPVAGWTEGTTYQFKGASFDLPTPKGFCIPDPSNRYDANLVKGKTAVMSNSGNRVVKLVAACNELKQPDFPYDFILYYYPVSSEKESLTGTTQSMRKTLCDDFRRPYDPKEAEEISAKTADELKQEMKLGKISNTKYLGILAEDAHGCYGRVILTTSNSKGPYVSEATLLVTVMHPNHSMLC